MKDTDKKILLIGVILLIAAGAGQFAARTFAGFGTWYSIYIYSKIVAVVGRLWGLLPVSGVELGLYGLTVLAFWYVIRRRKEWKSIASRAVLAIGVAAFLYTYQCGINYYRPPFSSGLNLEVRQSSVEELKEFCNYLTEKVNETVDSTPYSREWAVWGKEAMTDLGKVYPELSGYYPRAKPVTISWILSVQQLSGIYSPFTVEGNYNQDMTAYNIPILSVMSFPI